MIEDDEPWWESVRMCLNCGHASTWDSIAGEPAPDGGVWCDEVEDIVAEDDRCSGWVPDCYVPPRAWGA